MKSIIYHYLLLVAFQVHCYHQNDQDEHRYKRNRATHELLQCHDSSSAVSRLLTQKSPAYCKIVPSNSDFAFIFYKLIASDSAARNIFFSPLSISTAFAMLTLGAKSKTQEEILKAFAFNMSEMEMGLHGGFQHLLRVLNHPNNQALVTIGNSLFLNMSVKILPKFLEDAKTLYEAEAIPVNFNDRRMAVKSINDYVQNKTHGKITEALDYLDPDTIMVLVNYIFFKGYWKRPFDTRLIRKEDFFVDVNTTVKVNMMFQKEYHRYLYDGALSCWVVEIPYKGDATALFILPDQGKLEHVEGALVKETLSKWMTSFRSNEIRLYIPKVSMSASYDIKQLLQKIGVTSIFSDSGDLSGITGEPNVRVSKAVHRAVLDVDEGGTVAAAITVVEFGIRKISASPRRRTITITFDRPYIMSILHKPTNSVLFLGKIVNPAKP